MATLDPIQFDEDIIEVTILKKDMITVCLINKDRYTSAITII
jgi:hypothetical protein